jgi:hypothetical protein
VTCERGHGVRAGRPAEAPHAKLSDRFAAGFKI